MATEEGGEKLEMQEQVVLAEKSVSPSKFRLPNDLIFQLKVEAGEADDGLPTQNESIVLCNTVPALVNFTVGSSLEEMVSNIKFGYSENAKTPLTCMETGTCFNIQLDPKMVLVILLDTS
jgi:hypothetical protein